MTGKGGKGGKGGKALSGAAKKGSQSRSLRAGLQVTLRALDLVPCRKNSSIFEAETECSE